MKNMKSEKELMDKDINFELISLTQSVHSVRDVQKICKCEAQEVMKTLIFIGSNPIIVIMPGNKMANIEKINSITGDQNLRMATPNEIIKFTNYNVGSVSPFGINSDIKQIADNTISTLSYLFFGSGKNDVLIKISQTEFNKSFQGIFASISN